MMKNCKSPRKRYEIKNFEPYNEISNGQCFYRALFSVLNHYNIDIMNLLCNNVYFYGIVNDFEYGVYFDYLGLYEEPGMHYKELLAKSGIQMLAYCDVKDVITRIINSVSNDRPVIIYLDCYYEPIRPDMYMQTHVSHSIAIYGYDIDTEEFFIIEHDYVNGWNYKKRTLGFKDTENCYRGFVDDGRQERPSYFEFENNIVPDKSWNSKRVFMENYVYRSEVIVKGINALDQFIHMDFINKHSEIENGGDSFTYIYDSARKIVRNQKVRNYAISVTFENDPIIKELINKISNDWSMVMALIDKFRLTPIKRRIFSFDRCVESLNNILRNEKIIHEHILKHCKNSK